MSAIKKKKNVYRPPQSLVEQKSGKRKSSEQDILDREEKMIYRAGQFGGVRSQEVSARRDWAAEEEFSLESIDRLISEEFASGKEIPDLNLQDLDYYGLDDIQKAFSGEEPAAQVWTAEPEAPGKAEKKAAPKMRLEPKQPEQSEPKRPERPKPQAAASKKPAGFARKNALDKNRLLIAGLGFIVVCAAAALIFLIVKMVA